MSVQVYSAPGQTEGTRKDFLEWTRLEISLTCGSNVNYDKSVHHPIPTLPMGIGNTLENFKKISMLSFQLSVQVYYFLDQTEEERKTFFGGYEKVGLPARALGRHKR